MIEPVILNAIGDTADEMHISDVIRIATAVQDAVAAAGYSIVKTDTMRETLEFYGTGWFGHPGDSGSGGNTPQDPVLEPPEWLMEDGGERARQALASLTPHPLPSQ